LSVKHWQTMKGEKHNSSCTEECQAPSRSVPGDTRRYQACHNCVVLWWYYVPGVCVPSSGRSSSTSPPGDRTNRTVTAGRGRRIMQYSVPRSASNSTRMILGVLGVICFVLCKICRQCVSQVSQQFHDRHTQGAEQRRILLISYGASPRLKSVNFWLVRGAVMYY